MECLESDCKLFRKNIGVWQENYIEKLTKEYIQLCDYNVPYEISLKESINRGFLVPFHYYGIILFRNFFTE